MKASSLRHPVPRWWMRQCSAKAAIGEQLAAQEEARADADREATQATASAAAIEVITTEAVQPA